MGIQLISTPIEEYTVRRIPVRVKREDLCAQPPYPPLGKLRGLDSIVSSLLKNGVKAIGCWDTRVSELGVGLAAAMRDVQSGRAVFCYPQLDGGSIPSNVLAAQKLGAEIVAMRGNHPSICWAQARKLVEASGGVMLPFGLECSEAVEAVRLEANTVSRTYTEGGTVVVSCGSAVTLCGLLLGLRHQPSKVFAVSSGRSVAKIRKCIRRYVGAIPANVKIVQAQMRYEVPCMEPCPFPSHPNYDRKAWAFLRTNISEMVRPILFWNIGAKSSG